MTDALKHIARNTARYVGGQYVTKRYIDVIEPPKVRQDYTPDEVKTRLLKKLHGR